MISTDQQKKSSYAIPFVTMWLTKILITAFAYLVVSKIALLLAIPPGYATAVWPGAGIALVAILFFGYKSWPGIFIGSFLTNFPSTFDVSSLHQSAHSLMFLSALGMGASIQAIVGTKLIKKFVGYPNGLVQEKDLMLFLALGGPISCLIGCSIGVATLLAYGLIETYQAAITWGTWWVGDTIGVLVFAPMLLIWLGEPRKIWQQKWRSTFLPLCSMFLFVVFFFIQAREWEKQKIDSDFEQQTEQITQALKKNFDRNLEVVYALKAFYRSSEIVDRNEFHIFASDLLQRNLGVRGISWAPLVNSKNIQYYFDLAKKEGLDTYRIKKWDNNKTMIDANLEGEHITVFYVEPFEIGKGALGFDLLTTPERKEALERARDTGLATATGIVTLVQVSGKKQGFVIYLAIYKNGFDETNYAARKENLVGYVSAGFETQHLMEEALKGSQLGEIRLRLIDEYAVEGKKLIYDSKPNKILAKEDEISVIRNESMQIGGRTWRIEYSLSNKSMFTHQPWVAWSVLAVGLLFTALLGAFLFTIANSEARSAELVRIRTQELRESRERFELAVAGSNDGLWDWNLITNDLYISPRYKEMIGYKDHEFENSMDQVQEHIHPEDLDKVLGSAKEHIEKKHPFNVEFRFKTKSGDYKWIVTRGQAVWDEHGLPVRMVGFHTDITERKDIERMKNQFFDTISHELRTPLTPIHQFTTILQDGLGGEINQNQKDYLDIILKNTIQLQNIINDLVDVSRISTGKLSSIKERLDASALVNQIIQSFSLTAKGKDVQLSNFVPKDLPKIWADPIRFEQVLRNLIDNAIKFTPLQGNVVVRAVVQNGVVCFSVSDTGYGIEGDDKNKVFDRLYQSTDHVDSSRKGLGLGLYISKEIITDHGGSIWVESEVGRGSTFFFTVQIFSVQNLIQPLSKKTGQAPEEFGLISIQVDFNKKTIGESAKKETLRELESYLSNSIMDHDVVIPKTILGDEIFYHLIVVADKMGVEAAGRRIQKQWELKNKLGLADIKLKFNHRMIDFSKDPDFIASDTQTRMKMISSSIEHMINSPS